MTDVFVPFFISTGTRYCWQGWVRWLVFWLPDTLVKKDATMSKASIISMPMQPLSKNMKIYFF